jgi:hypothetical protein
MAYTHTILPFAATSRQQPTARSSHASEHSPPAEGALVLKHRQHSRSDMQPDSGQGSGAGGLGSDRNCPTRTTQYLSRYTRPETHQNLIHSNKEQTPPRSFPRSANGTANIASRPCPKTGPSEDRQDGTEP